MEIPELDALELHIWILDIPGDRLLDSEELPPLRFEDFTAGNLSEAECAQAGRFRFPRDQHRFALCRSALRHLAGAYARIDPVAIRFQTGLHGKPYLEVGQSEVPLQFNLSHTRGMGVFAFQIGAEVGIDVENSHRRVNELELGQRVFTPAELDSLRPLDPQGRRERFFAFWTAKEAFLKATGFGLSLDPRKVEVILPDGDETAGCFSVPGGEVETSPWVLRSFCRNGEYRISTACSREITPARIRVFDYERAI